MNLKEAVKGLVTPQGKNLISYPYTSKEGTGSGGLEHHVVGLTNQVYSGLFSYPVAES